MKNKRKNVKKNPKGKKEKHLHKCANKFEHINNNLNLNNPNHDKIRNISDKEEISNNQKEKSKENNNLQNDEYSSNNSN